MTRADVVRTRALADAQAWQEMLDATTSRDETKAAIFEACSFVEGQGPNGTEYGKVEVMRYESGETVVVKVFRLRSYNRGQWRPIAQIVLTRGRAAVISAVGWHVRPMSVSQLRIASGFYSRESIARTLAQSERI